MPPATRRSLDAAAHGFAALLTLSASVVGCDGASEQESVAERAQSLSLPGITLKTMVVPRFVGAQNNGGGAVIASATAAQGWETFTLDDLNGGELSSGDSVLIRAGSGQYFQAVNGGGSTLNAASSNQLGWETFKIVRQVGAGVVRNGDVIGFQTASGAWISAQNGGGSTVFAYGGGFGSWEQFAISGLPSSAARGTAIANVNLKTVLQGRFLGAQNNGGGAVVATATQAQGWETFTLEDANGGSLQSGDTVYVRTGGGQYFQAEGGGGAGLNAGGVGKDAFSTFKLVRQAGAGDVAPGDVVGLRTASGAWVSAQNGGGGAVFAYGGALGSWEQLVFGIGTSTASPSNPMPPSERGARLGYLEYEAEDMQTDGVVLGPTRAYGQIAAEASGRRAVRLAGTGQSVRFTSAAPASSIVVRYSIPDGGSDYWASLGVYVNGALRTRLRLTSRYSWTYGGDDDFNKSYQNDPARGNAHHFFDEARALIGDVPAGATVMLRKDASDAAARYDIDLVDLEQVAAPLSPPAGSLSISECGATANDDSDDSAAIQRCVDRARGESRVLWIPPGTYNSYSKPISVAGVTVRGAGMWHSTIAGYFARFDCWANDCKYYDFAVNGDSTERIDSSTDTAFTGAASSGVVLDGIWVEHTRVGYWVGPRASGVTIKNSRFRNLFADGVNFYGGTSNSVCENNHVRNTGDDAFASWSDTDNGYPINGNNVFRNNTVQLPWKANCFALYGGSNNRVEDNVCVDTAHFPGILLARQFSSHPFTGSTQIARNTLVRAGGWAWNQEHGALKLHADQGDIANVVVSDLEVVSPTYYGVHVQGQGAITGVTLSGATVSGPGSGAFFLNWGSRGSLFVERVVASGSPQGVRNDSGGNFSLVRGAGNSGW